MYSGTSFHKYSGRVLGAHQKIDRLARRSLATLIENQKMFPSSKEIINFEGKNGPDGIKVKSPAKDEPWHYYDPFDPTDINLNNLISNHFEQLVDELKEGNRVKSSFEAAWLAHAIVDGLTPAHHFPYEKKLMELSGGAGIESRNTIRKKTIMPGENSMEKFKNNWKMWGGKGLFITHMWFEMGIAFILLPLGVKDCIVSDSEIRQAKKLGLLKIFERAAREIAVLDMYDKYYEKGWTPKLAYQVRHKLSPVIVKTVTLAWYLAISDTGLIKRHKKARA